MSCTKDTVQNKLSNTNWIVHKLKCETLDAEPDEVPSALSTIEFKDTYFTIGSSNIQYAVTEDGVVVNSDLYTITLPEDDTLKLDIGNGCYILYKLD